MDINKFNQTISPVIESKISRIAKDRIEDGYLDISVLNDIILDIEKQIPVTSFFKLLDSNKNDEALYTYNKQFQLIVLLKCLYVFTDVFINIILSEILDINFIKFMYKPTVPINRIHPKYLLSIYCIITYRNKIIIHHDVRRQYGFSWTTSLSKSKLFPQILEFHISEEDIEVLHKLKEKYKSNIPTLLSETNVFTLLEILYYNIPIWESGDVNQDRLKINGIAEHGGCPSNSWEEIIDAIDKFVENVIKEI